MIQKHFVIDLETLGLRENAVVLSLGAVVFTFKHYWTIEHLRQQSFYCKFNVDEQIALKREIDESTLEFWAKQDSETIEMNVKPSNQDVSLKDGLTQFSKFLKQSQYDWETSFLWARGKSFDFPKIESLYNCAEIKLPFNSKKQRDIWTYVDCLTGSIDGQYKLQNQYEGQCELIKHHALSDCLFDVLVMNEIFQLAVTNI